MSEKMAFKLPVGGSLADKVAGGGRMEKTPVTPTSPANFDFLMRRASAVYEAQFEVILVRLVVCTSACMQYVQLAITTAECW